MRFLAVSTAPKCGISNKALCPRHRPKWDSLLPATRSAYLDRLSHPSRYSAGSACRADHRCIIRRARAARHSKMIAIVASPATRAQKPALSVSVLTNPPPSIASNNAIVLQQKSSRLRIHDAGRGADIRYTLETQKRDDSTSLRLYSTRTRRSATVVERTYRCPRCNVDGPTRRSADSETQLGLRGFGYSRSERGIPDGACSQVR